MAVEIINRTRNRINRQLITRSVEAVLAFKKIKGDVSIAIIGDTAMRRLNKKFRAKDKPTDILSFVEKESESPLPGFIGELFIDLEQIKRQSKVFKTGVTWELAFITIHGALHLLGYEDETEPGRIEMELLGNKIIKKVI